MRILSLSGGGESVWKHRSSPLSVENKKLLVFEYESSFILSKKKTSNNLLYKSSDYIVI